MSDGRKVPERSAPQQQQPQRTVTNPNARAISAARPAAASAEKKGSEKQVSQRLKSEASNVFLNALSIIKEKVQELREQDNFFKYKAGIIGGWALVSVLSIVIACPGQGIETTALGARVTLLPNADKPTANPSLTVTNTDTEPWENVVFVVNGKYSTRTIPKIDAGSIFTVTPRLLANNAGTPMPPDERFYQAEMRTDDGKAELVREGQPLTQ
ncbi:hypothetical protein [Hyalangium rubrum]|uniref:Uncharacterized protein n=1 Tax=Hyalangium rubrum TaxID=3103134 RepID=A0ABU5HEZ9_9BACT|nr:hypothetical protein [Hyalangium sp. s54d21]MDY7230650.1 hypothetical protein [Hyalangium sp. s54d21]